MGVAMDIGHGREYGHGHDKDINFDMNNVEKSVRVADYFENFLQLA